MKRGPPLFLSEWSHLGERRVRRVTLLDPRVLACENFELRFLVWALINNQGDRYKYGRWGIPARAPWCRAASSSAFVSLEVFELGFPFPQGRKIGPEKLFFFSLALFSYILGVFTRALLSQISFSEQRETCDIMRYPTILSLVLVNLEDS